MFLREKLPGHFLGCKDKLIELKRIITDFDIDREKLAILVMGNTMWSQPNMPRVELVRLMLFNKLKI